MRYKLPALKEANESEPDIAYEPEDFPGRWDRELRIPVNGEILKQVKAGKSVTLTVKGKVTEVVNRESENKRNEQLITVELSEVELHGPDKAQASMDKGFAKARGR